MSYLLLGVRSELLVVFALAAVGKLRNHKTFASFVESVRALKVVPSALVVPSATLIAAGELSVAATLLPAATVTIGLSIAAATLGLFTAVIVYSIGTRHRAACNCFGADGALLSQRHVIRNVLLLASAGIGIWLSGQHVVSVSHVGRGGLVALAAGGIVGFIFTQWDELSFVLVGEATASSV